MSTTVKAVHYSTKKLALLSTLHYGTGLKGAEAVRLRAPRAVTHRLYFYVDTGKGIVPEVGVGHERHEVTLTNLYNIIKDPKMLKKQHLDWSDNAWWNWVENEIVTLGYTGIYNPLAQDTQGVAVLLGEHLITLS
jgi:hypothetical protein